MEKETTTFTYTYSAKQQEEIRGILKKYTPNEPGEDKMEQLRRLDQSVTRKGSAVSTILGILSSLLLGIGMCYSMLWSGYSVIGIAIGIVGLIGAALAYPVYSLVTKRERERVAPQIIALSNELMK